MPGIYSQLGAAGLAGSGLDAAALGQAGIDAYARLFPQQQAYQLQAAQLLPQVMQQPLDLQTRLLSAATGASGQYAPFVGQYTTGTQAGQQAGQTLAQQLGLTSGQTTGQQFGSQYGETAEQALSRSITEAIARQQQAGTEKTKGTQTTTQPVYQPGPLDYALGGL